MKNCIGIILAGGIGSRCGLKIPKQYALIDNKELISYSIDVFKKIDIFDEIVAVADSFEHVKYIQEKYNISSIKGGSTRNESFNAALKYIAKKYPMCEKIIVNEAARPLITEEIIRDFYNALNDYSCVYCVKNITDSLETKTGQYVDRTKYQLVMSPEGYDFKIITKYFNEKSEITFPGHCIPDNYKKYMYDKFTNNTKLTYNTDIVLLEKMLKK